ncbi:WXG100 family type VII secretion target [Anaerorhabdus furcosa]|uniref:WXG100 family type VII secretion target n=1 Tax=Anaerorhabdus furcosa TaxID=118967 RepID=A0A1T4PCA5_9FIRM|nr:WXG100 family type VII secretion target [Anaerorhabdus furcosa]SJZ89142.1 WXG100 family type VII secretion target [Anaerorhabdus furcosa]
MRKIYVDPERLEISSRKIDSEAQQYEKKFIQLFDEVEKMKNAWQGKDNIAFTNQIRSFENDFRQIYVITQQYSEFLKSSARAYREMQNELMNQVNRL